MDLNQYPSSELRTLQMALAFTKQYLINESNASEFPHLDKWASRVNDAIKDAEFEETYRGSSVDTLLEITKPGMLAQHILDMKDDAHFNEHPEWSEIVSEAKKSREITKPIVRFPVSVQLTSGTVHEPSLQKLTLVWPRLSPADKILYTDHFKRTQNVDIAHVIEFAHEYAIIEPDYSKCKPIVAKPWKEHRMSEYEYELQHRMVEAQKLK
jgi:hypothetical protein